ncbi:Multiple inositol polyphosphate phosphatase 1 [Camellia lanceoleosa]|uniref:Multiple inositol polyphosphate phosphatase 1 n=1 Tax=Camellia lanceoleosa TaxID=1840588 RepID=A0ACC0H888_9ERIC|nr:Multiple inositol polyphosphate phosphatase 1 [Camellia lanceoleosa]
MEKEAIEAVLLLFLSAVLVNSNAQEQPFDVRQHLSTVTRYGVVKDISDNLFVPSNIADQCTPIHLNLVARHGTRAPTKKRIKELDNLAIHLEVLLQDAKEQKLDLQKVPAWFWGWKSPWKGKLRGGELISEGEDELYQLAIRIREKFSQLFNEDYHPDIYAIKATQIPRASASAVAFGMGLFSGRGNLGPGHHRAFAVTSESRASDIWLRFHDCCQNYKAFRKSQEPAVQKLKEPILDEITHALVRRYELNFTRQDTSSLWFLCKEEASLLNITDRACASFTPSEVALLEWTDDLGLFILKGYGNALNYRMGVPLLEDVVQSMEQAIKAKDEEHAPGSYEKARLRFAHAETLVPFSCLLGLFLEGSEFEKIQKEQPLQLPPKPPHRRNWRGSTVAAFAGNNMLALYSCPDKSSSKYFVQVLHNERPVPMPGCDNSDFCPFEVFKERIVAPHLKHDYNTICNLKSEQQEQIPFTSKLSQMFRWLFSQRSNDDTRSAKAEL